MHTWPWHSKRTSWVHIPPFLNHNTPPPGDRKAQELSNIINRLEEERTRHAGNLVRLQERLTEQEAHSTAVESQLDHYNTQLKILHDEIEKKEKQVSTLKAEVTEIILLNKGSSVVEYKAGQVLVIYQAIRYAHVLPQTKYGYLAMQCLKSQVAKGSSLLFIKSIHSLCPLPE